MQWQHYDSCVYVIFFGSGVKNGNGPFWMHWMKLISKIVGNISKLPVSLCAHWRRNWRRIHSRSSRTFPWQCLWWWALLSLHVWWPTGSSLNPGWVLWEFCPQLLAPWPPLDSFAIAVLFSLGSTWPLRFLCLVSVITSFKVQQRIDIEWRKFFLCYFLLLFGCTAWPKILIIIPRLTPG